MSGPPTHTETDEVHAHPRHTGHGWFDLIAAITALVISGVSLFVGIEHSETTRQLVAANSWPILQMEQEFDGYSQSGNGLVSGPIVQNAGVGPAKIERFTLLYNGRPYRSYAAFLRDCCGYDGKNADWAHRMTPRGIGVGKIAGLVLRPGDTETVIETRTAAPDDSPFFQAFDKAMSKLTYRACYCSVFDECWTSDLRTLHPKSVKACPADASEDTTNDL